MKGDATKVVALVSVVERRLEAGPRDARDWQVIADQLRAAARIATKLAKE
jgi:hypothetical protein